MCSSDLHVTPTSISATLDAIRSWLEPQGVEVVYAEGCQTHRRLPELDLRMCSTVTVEIHEDPERLDDPAAVPMRSRPVESARVIWQSDPTGRRSPDPTYGARVVTDFVPTVTGEWQFGIESVSPARLLVDGKVVIDNTDVAAGGSFFGTGRGQVVASVPMEEGRPYRLVVEVRRHPRRSGLDGVNIGALAPVFGDLVDAAVDVAASCDLSIVVVGTNDDWESEGWDREGLDLPGDQNVLVHEAAKVSRRTVVIVNSGSPVSMPWLDDVQAVVQSWFAGQEMGEALADVLTGVAEPSGRLPIGRAQV